MQHSMKLGGTNYHFKWVKVPVPPFIERPALKCFMYAWEFNFLLL